jgi:hypothetical protein
VKFDLTGYALSAWAIVSLGLTVWWPPWGNQAWANGLEDG